MYAALFLYEYGKEGTTAVLSIMISEEGLHMYRKKQYQALLAESELLSGEIHKLSAGQLDLKIPDTETLQLSEIAGAVNDISAVLAQYICEISRVLSHLSVGDLTVRVSKEVSFTGNFYPIKNALNKMGISLNEIFSHLNEMFEMIQKLCDSSTQQAHETAEHAAKQAEEINHITNLVNRISDETSENMKSVERMSAAITNADRSDYLDGKITGEEMLEKIKME